MLSKKLLIGFAALGMGIASAARTYKVEFTQTTQVGATELKAGEYKVEMQGDKAIFKSGKDVVAQRPRRLKTASRSIPRRRFRRTLRSSSRSPLAAPR